MHKPSQFQIAAASSAEIAVIFDCVATDSKHHLLTLSVTQEEFQLFQEVLALRPFGASNPHRACLHYLKHAKSHYCGVRVSSHGSRKDIQIPVSPETFIGLEYIFNQFALDPELIPDKPPSVREQTANPAFQGTQGDKARGASDLEH